MRHAKAQPDAETDFLRPLSKRGHEQAAQCAQWIESLPFVVDAALVSAALRTTQTWEGLQIECAVKFTQDAYTDHVETLVHLVREFGAEAESLLLVGHNPGISDLAFANGYAQELSPCTAVVVEITTDWSQFGLIEGTPAQVFIPSKND